MLPAMCNNKRRYITIRCRSLLSNTSNRLSFYQIIPNSGYHNNDTAHN